MGPPRFAPNWLRVKRDFPAGGWLKKLRASKRSLRRNSKASPWKAFVPERVAMLTIAPELRPYSALKVWLSTLNSWTVLIDGWKVIWFCTMSLRFTPLIMKFTVSSRLPAVLKANEPWPLRGAVRNPDCGGVTEPGMSRPRSTKWRPLSGISCTVRWLMTWPTELVAVSITGASAVTVISSATPPRLSRKFWTTVRATSRRSSLATWVWKPGALTSTR